MEASVCLTEVQYPAGIHCCVIERQNPATTPAPPPPPPATTTHTHTHTTTTTTPTHTHQGVDHDGKCEMIRTSIQCVDTGV